MGPGWRILKRSTGCSLDSTLICLQPLSCQLSLTDEALDYVQTVVHEEDNNMLTQFVTSDKVEPTIFDLSIVKAPGPDGFSALFYQSSWEEVKEEVREMVDSFFTDNTDLDLINSTNIMLIPKNEKPESINHFRLLGLCNVVYKVIAKILTRRMKHLMSRSITQQQRAFVAGRLIQDNVVVAQEDFHHLKLEKKGKRVELALKIDLSKAYDRVEWCFLKRVM